MSEQTAVPMTITSYNIRNKIYTIRGLQVMLDADLAELYHVNTKALNQAVKRNINRFPSSFCFQLTLAEKEELVTTCDRLTRLKHSSVCPNVFTESGVAMLSAILRSDVAVNTSIAIMNAFISLRHYMADNAVVFQRLDRIEIKQLEADEKFNQLFKQLDMLAKKKPGVSVEIHTTQKNCKLTQKEVDSFSGQYGSLNIKYTNEFHDRFLILDSKELYHIGASIKDAGKKAFEISLNNDEKMLTSLL